MFIIIPTTPIVLFLFVVFGFIRFSLSVWGLPEPKVLDVCVVPKDLPYIVREGSSVEVT